MPCCEISDRAQMSKTIIAVRHFALGGREWHGGKDGVRSTEYGVRSAEYGVRSTECGVRSAEYGVRSLSLKCFFRFGGDFKTDSVFSTLWGHKVENAESVLKVFL